MWSLGCILGEMLLGKPMFPGSSTIDQIERIMSVIPQPNRDDLHHVSSQYASSLLNKPLCSGTSKGPAKTLRDLLAGAPTDAIDLLEKLMVFNPDKRLTAEQALRHPYVARFHNAANEPCLARAVVPCLRDDVQLSVDIYRNKLYELIATRKTRLRNSSSSERLGEAGTGRGTGHTTGHGGSTVSHARRSTHAQANHNNNNSSSSSSHSTNNNSSSCSHSTNNNNSSSHSTSASTQALKVKVVARRVERPALVRVEEGGRRSLVEEGRRSSKDSDKSSAKSSSSSSSPGSCGRHKSISPPLSRSEPPQPGHHRATHHHHSGN
ncbi:Mitogen-activated protein kinase 15 [Chionoecetes opilio]|uniref:Mitogen-activated protein kinase 15 n=1 Tax=Chionoecetes opilio TaxID=41210 RepID=A0A8J5CZH3_CHIOP|nr:Mitogen-activated protein kinase 15 [Chionoecetes opilio]